MLPFQVQVSASLALPVVIPPKRTTFPVAGSLTIDPIKRAGGLVAGDCCVQVAVDASETAGVNPTTAATVSATPSNEVSLGRCARLKWPHLHALRVRLEEPRCAVGAKDELGLLHPFTTVAAASIVCCPLVTIWTQFNRYQRKMSTPARIKNLQCSLPTVRENVRATISPVSFGFHKVGT